MKPFLELEGLCKRFADGTLAVAGLDLACAEGELVVLLGPSGCGKTTTLRMVAGLETPTSGSIRLGGQEQVGRPPRQRDVGFVFQFQALYPHLTVYDNIAFPLQCAGLSAAQVRQRVGEMIECLDLGALARRRPRALVGGDPQRVALARALVRRPRLWLMDEPLGTLDAGTRLALRELIRAQQLELGVTTVYVTHDQEEAMAIADRIAVMDAGAIRQAGPPGQVYDRPEDLFVAHFIGSPGMNLLTGRLERGAAPRLAMAGGAAVPIDAPESAAEGALLTLGVRPEFVVPGQGGALPATVVVDERLGSHRHVHLDTPAGPLVMRRPPLEANAPGAALRVGFAPQRVRLFDAATGRSL